MVSCAWRGVDSVPFGVVARKLEPRRFVVRYKPVMTYPRGWPAPVTTWDPGASGSSGKSGEVGLSSGPVASEGPEDVIVAFWTLDSPRRANGGWHARELCKQGGGVRMTGAERHTEKVERPRKDLETSTLASPEYRCTERRICVSIPKR